jgi:4-amino-4-deoxy-L-arabinose transferase-like glycosyltransferase
VSRSDRIALILSLLAILAAYIVAERVFERMPHIEDEIAYVWQAQAIARGHLSVPTPAHPNSFLVPFVVDYNGQRFGKYPLSWPAALAVGVFFEGRAWVNSLLAGLGLWLTYRLGQRLFSPAVGLLAALLTLTSPFFLMNSGSLLSHPFGLALSAAFALVWLDAWDSGSSRPRLAAITSGLCLGLLAFTRPLTGVGVVLPFVPHAAILWLRGDWSRRRRLLAFALIAMVLTSLLFVWQWAMTGDPLFNPYTLWWKYDKVGFGPGVGRLAGGHTLHQAWINTKYSLWVGWHDYFGWGRFSWIFLPFGALALLRVRQFKALPVALVFPSLVVVYLAYWIGSSLFGPRYFYEGLYSLTLLSSSGIAWLAGWPLREGDACPDNAGWWRLRPLLVIALLALLLSTNLLFYTPIRLGSMHGLYGLSRARMEPFLSAQAQGMTPALVIVHPDYWTEYGSLLELTSPFLDTPFLLAISVGEEADAALAADYPERKIYDYYPDKPWVFFRRGK